MITSPLSRLSVIAFAVGALGLSLPAQAQLDSHLQRFSYAMGMQVARQLNEQGIPRVDPAALALAVDDMLNGRQPRLTLEQIQESVLAIQETIATQRRALAASNLAAAQAFLAQNRAADGIVESESGVQYRVVKAGDGARPAKTDKVKVHYRGQLLNGREFDSSIRRGEPAEFAVGQVIPGWQEVLQLMSVGSTWEVWIPPQLAYGERGSGKSVGPNEMLHFQIELLSVAEEAS